MRTIKNKSDLVGYTLEYDDIVIFDTIHGIFEYHVKDDYMEIIGFNNRILFQVLKIDSRSFSSEHYGYSITSGGDWPECKIGDYMALTRLVKGLYDTITPQSVIGDSKLTFNFINNI